MDRSEVIKATLYDLLYYLFKRPIQIPTDKQIPDKCRSMQLLRSCFPLFGSFDGAKDTKAHKSAWTCHCVTQLMRPRPKDSSQCGRIRFVLPHLWGAPHPSRPVLVVCLGHGNFGHKSVLGGRRRLCSLSGTA